MFEARKKVFVDLLQWDLPVTTYTGVAEPAWLRQILTFGWSARALGPVRSINGMLLGALRIEIATDTHARLDRAGIIGRHACLRAEAA